LLEFVQNADDNSYASGVIPTLCFKLEDGQISIQCNEVGFKAENVVAICKIGASTKKNVQGYIGEISGSYDHHVLVQLIHSTCR